MKNKDLKSSATKLVIGWEFWFDTNSCSRFLHHLTLRFDLHFLLGLKMLSGAFCFHCLVVFAPHRVYAEGSLTLPLEKKKTNCTPGDIIRYVSCIKKKLDNKTQ